jgi:hypothetical protein
MTLIKGALIEYNLDDMYGSLPNVIIFQFNPVNLKRSITKSTGATNKEIHQSAKPPTETITFTATFSANVLKYGMYLYSEAVVREFGIGPQLAALEKMITPIDLVNQFNLGLDAIGESVSPPKENDPIPRLKSPRILFIWGKSRILPVLITSLGISEEYFDSNLNPIEANVDINLTVLSSEGVKDDKIASGALKYTLLAKETLASANLANVPTQASDYINF